MMHSSAQSIKYKSYHKSRKNTVPLNHQPITSTLKQEMYSSLLLVPRRGKMHQNDSTNQGMQGIYVVYLHHLTISHLWSDHVTYQPGAMASGSPWRMAACKFFNSSSSISSTMNGGSLVLRSGAAHGSTVIFVNLCQLNSNWGSC